jgi:hypothetical protein
VAKPALFLVVVLLSGCTTAGTAAGSAAPTPVGSGPSAASAGCAYDVRRDVLPAWARTGFSDPSPSGIPYVMGTKGDVLGVLFGYPLTAPAPSAGRSNKILWRSRVPVTPPDTLRIQARLAGTTETVDREVPGGPGPSIIDLPRPGCWHLTLTWSGHIDALDLRYEPA